MDVVKRRYSQRFAPAGRRLDLLTEDPHMVLRLYEKEIRLKNS